MVVENVSLAEVLAAARGRHASLVPESSGYLLLGLFQATAGRPSTVDAAGILLSSEGTVSTAPGRTRMSPEQATSAIRQLLAELLAASKGRSPALTALTHPNEDASGRLDLLAAGITKALIPINRGAAKRALARLARETLRAKASGLLKVDESIESSRALAAVAVSTPDDAGVALAGADSVVAAVGSGPALAEPAGVVANAMVEDWDDLDVDIELATPTPAPAIELALDDEELPPAAESKGSSVVELEAEPATIDVAAASEAPAPTSPSPVEAVSVEVASEEVAEPSSEVAPVEPLSAEPAFPDLTADRPTMPDHLAAAHAKRLAATRPDQPARQIDPLQAEEHLVRRLLGEATQGGHARVPVAPSPPVARPSFAKAPGDASSADALLERFADGDGEVDQLLAAAHDLTRLVVGDASPTPPPAAVSAPGVLGLLAKRGQPSPAQAERETDEVESLPPIAAAVRAPTPHPVVAEAATPPQSPEPSPEPSVEASEEPSAEPPAPPAEPEPKLPAPALAAEVLVGDCRLEESLDRSVPIPMVVPALPARAAEVAELSPSALPVSCDADDVSMSVMSTEISLIPNDASSLDEPEVAIELAASVPPAPVELDAEQPQVVTEPEPSAPAGSVVEASAEDELPEGELPEQQPADDDEDEQLALDAEVAFSVSPEPVQVDEARNTVSGLPPPGSEHRRRWPVAASLVTLLTGMAALALVVVRPAWLSPVLPTSLTEPAAAESAGPTADSSEAASRCHAKLTLTGLPSPHEILVRLGEAPLTTRPLPTGVRLELVATANGQQPQRVVIPADARWVEVTEGERKLAVDLLLEPTSDPAWPPAAAGQVGGVGPEGRIHVTTNPSAEIWLVAGAGEEERQSIVVPCAETAHILVVDPGAPDDPHRLSVAAKLLEAAARSGGADIPVGR